MGASGQQDPVVGAGLAASVVRRPWAAAAAAAAVVGPQGQGTWGIAGRFLHTGAARIDSSSSTRSRHPRARRPSAVPPPHQHTGAPHHPGCYSRNRVLPSVIAGADDAARPSYSCASTEGAAARPAATARGYLGAAARRAPLRPTAPTPRPNHANHLRALARSPHLACGSCLCWAPSRAGRVRRQPRMRMARPPHPPSLRDSTQTRRPRHQRPVRRGRGALPPAAGGMML